MKKVCFVLLAVLISTSFFAQTLNLKDITDGKYKAKGIASVTSSTDGEFYFQADQSKTKIIKFSYKTGQAVETVFDIQTARECTISSFEGFIMSPDENRLIVYTNSEQIYHKILIFNYSESEVLR